MSTFLCLFVFLACASLLLAGCISVQQQRRRECAPSHLAGRLSHEDKNVREEAVRRLLRIGKPRAIPPLVALLADARGDVRESAAMVLRKLNWEPETLKERFFYLVARQAWGELIAIGEQSIWPLLNVFAGGDHET